MSLSSALVPRHSQSARISLPCSKLQLIWFFLCLSRERCFFVLLSPLFSRAKCQQSHHHHNGEPDNQDCWLSPLFAFSSLPTRPPLSVTSPGQSKYRLKGPWCIYRYRCCAQIDTHSALHETRAGYPHRAKYVPQGPGCPSTGLLCPS